MIYLKAAGITAAAVVGSAGIILAVGPFWFMVLLVVAAGYALVVRYMMVGEEIDAYQREFTGETWKERNTRVHKKVS